MSSEVENGGNERSGQSPGVPVPPPNEAVGLEESRCPQCGGGVRRRWGTVFVFNLVTLLALGALPFFVLPFHPPLDTVVGEVLGLMWLVLGAVALFTLPITGGIALAARPRCRTCGHRFWPSSVVAGRAAAARFPVRFAVISSAIILAPLALGMAFVAAIPGREVWAVEMLIGRRILMALLAPGAALVAQALLWRRTRTAGAVREAFVLLLPAVILGSGWLALTMHDHRAFSRKYDPVVRAPGILAWAQLAPLPPSAQGVAVNFWAAMLSGECYLRFAAEPNDIEQFLADSATLRGVACQRYSKTRMRIKAVDYGQVFRESRDGHEYFHSIDVVPPWYQEEIRGAARRYEVSIREGLWRGEVIVNDEQHVVYMHLSRY